MGRSNSHLSKLCMCIESPSQEDRTIPSVRTRTTKPTLAPVSNQEVNSMSREPIGRPCSSLHCLNEFSIERGLEKDGIVKHWSISLVIQQAPPSLLIHSCSLGDWVWLAASSLLTGKLPIATSPRGQPCYVALSRLHETIGQCRAEDERPLRLDKHWSRSHPAG